MDPEELAEKVNEQIDEANCMDRRDTSSHHSDNQSSKDQGSVSSFGVLSYNKENLLSAAMRRKTLGGGHTNLITDTLMKLAMQREAEQSETRSNESMGMFGDSTSQMEFGAQN